MSAAGVRRVIVAVGLLVGALPVGAQTTLPPDFPLSPAESSPGTVTFSHRTHMAKLEKCTTCHMRDFKMKRGASGPITLAAKQEGKFCGACHDGQRRAGRPTAFPIDECDRCHR